MNPHISATLLPPKPERSCLGRAIFSLMFLLAAALFAHGQFIGLARVKLDPMSHREWVTQILVAPSGKEIISAGADGRIVFWDKATGKSVREVKLSAIILTISLTRDGRTLAAGDASGTVSLIDTESGKTKSTFTADEKIVNTAAWNEDGKFLAVGGSGGIVKIWSAAEQKITGEINPGHGTITALVFSKSNLVVGLWDNKNSDRSAEIWDWENKKLVRTFDEGPAAFRGISVSPDGKLLAIADFEKAILLSILFGEGNNAEMSLRVLPDSDDGTYIAIWDLTTGNRTALIKAENGARSVAFSPDGKLLAASGPNGAIIYDAGRKTFADIGRIESRTSIDSVVFGPDSQELFLARENEPLVKPGEGGVDKLFDPVITSLVMQVREGINSGAALNLGGKDTKSVTGGSSIELWKVNNQMSASQAKTFAAVAAIYEDKDEEAVKILQEVIAEHPKYGEAGRILAVLLAAQDLEKAQSILKAAVKEDPNCFACWRTLGDLQNKAGRPLEALDNYRRVLQLKPEYGFVAGLLARVYNQLANISIMSGNTEANMQAAKTSLNEALKLRPADQMYITNLAAAYYFRGDFDKDIELLLLAQRLRPDSPRVYYNLGHAYRFTGNKKLAIQAYRRYVQMGEEGEEDRVEKAKEFIKQLSQ